MTRETRRTLRRIARKARWIATYVAAICLALTWFLYSLSSCDRAQEPVGRTRVQFDLDRR
ncbi:MAG: hypothetical protein Kow0092_25320 [Deferrisomatales bacterium]